MAADRATDHVFLGWALERNSGPPGPLTATIDGELAAVWPWQRVPHCLIVGGTGGGKTTLTFVMATHLIHAVPAAQRALVLVDAQGSDSFICFAGIPGVATASGPGEFADAVDLVHGQTLERITRLKQARQQAAATRSRVPYASPPWLILDIDEYLIGVMRLPKPRRTQTIAKLIDVGLGGRKVKVRLVLAAQRPDAKSVETGLPGLLKAELKARIAQVGELGMDGLESQMAFDATGYADKLMTVSRDLRRRGIDPQGVGLVKVAGWDVAFKTPWLADPTDPETAAADAAAAWRRIPRPVDPMLPA